MKKGTYKSNSPKETYFQGKKNKNKEAVVFV